MKTPDNLKALIPSIVDYVATNEHNIGIREYDEDERCVCSDYEQNHVTYEEDGWLIEVGYKCCGNFDDGELLNAWGKVTEITASSYDEQTDTVTEYCQEELRELRKEIDKALSYIE